MSLFERLVLTTRMAPEFTPIGFELVVDQVARGLDVSICIPSLLSYSNLNWVQVGLTIGFKYLIFCKYLFERGKKAVNIIALVQFEENHF